MRLLACIAIAWSSSLMVLAGQTTARLETADTGLQLAAGPAAPQVVAMAFPHQIPWVNTSAEQLIGSVVIDDSQVAVHWQLDSAASSVGPHQVTFVYNSKSPRLRLSWKWQARAAFGPIEHEIQIENLDNRAVWLSLQPSFRFSWQIHSGVKVEQLYVEKGANTPSEVGTHLAQVVAGYRWRGISSTYAHPNENEPREIIPWFLLEETTGSKNGWYVGIEFSGRTELRLQRDSDSLTGVAGLNPDPGPFRTRLAPGENFDTPAIFLGASKGGLDAAGNVMRRWVRAVLGNPQAWSNSNYPLLVNNSWGGGMKVNEEIAHAMIRDAADLGIEMFHQDAGWFRGVGDWYPNPQKFPHGLAAIADDAHKHGMKFGLWSIGPRPHSTLNRAR